MMPWLMRIGRFICRIKGHAMMVQFERHRMYLVCSSCGEESPGWVLR